MVTATLTKRQERAKAALDASEKAGGPAADDTEAAIPDLIADLMHYAEDLAADSDHADGVMVWERGRDHFDAERDQLDGEG